MVSVSVKVSNIKYDKEKIKANPLNRFNAIHIAELVAYAQHELHQAQRMAHATQAQQKAKDAAIAGAQLTLDERMAKLSLYREIFPEKQVVIVKYSIIDTHLYELVFCMPDHTIDQIIEKAKQQLNAKWQSSASDLVVANRIDL
jgi:hypothetical protein